MSLMDHVIGLLTPPVPGSIKVGMKVTKVRLDGCMATVRVEEWKGEVIGLAPDYKDPFGHHLPLVIIVREDGAVEKEPEGRFKLLEDGRVEIWY
jgi:hypothetical protein